MFHGRFSIKSWDLILVIKTKMKTKTKKKKKKKKKNPDKYAVTQKSHTFILGVTGSFQTGLRKIRGCFCSVAKGKVHSYVNRRPPPMVGETALLTSQKYTCITWHLKLNTFLLYANLCISHIHFSYSSKDITSLPWTYKGPVSQNHYYTTKSIIYRGAGSDTIYQPLRSGRIWHKVNF